MDSHKASIKKLNSRDQFQKYFFNQEEFSGLCDSCVTGDTEGIACRWTAWRTFLGLLPLGDEAKIREQVKKQRSYYATEYDKYMNFRAKSRLSADEDNPLSTAASNPWNSFYTDSYIKEEIQKDIERTYRAVDFFLSKSIETLMANVLFIWAKQNADISYRQGMNEIVALLTHVCFTENYQATNPEQDIYDFINDENYAEADIYTVFKRIMECEQKSMFIYQPPQSDKPTKKKKPEPGDVAQRPNLPFVHRAVYIQEDLLPQLHPYLFSHFKAMGVEPNIYMMRWLRCMLATEFKLNQALQLWDAIFGYQCKYAPDAKKFKMLDYLCVMMILNISDELLGIDNGGIILGRLLKYPPTDDVNAFISICNSHILAHLHAGGVKKDTSSTSGIESADSNSQPDSAPEEEQKPNLSNSPNKKLVLFNPQMSIFKPKKGISAKPEDNAYDPENPLAGPMVKKRPAETKPVNQTSQISPPKQTVVSSNSSVNTTGAQEQVQAKTSPEKSIVENDILSQPKPKENPVLFGAGTTGTSKPSNPFARELPKETPALFGGNQGKGAFPFGAEPKATGTLPNVIKSTEKDSAECIKKLQNAIKLIKLESEKNGSLELEEALTDLNSVMKIIKEKMSKS